MIFDSRILCSWNIPPEQFEKDLKKSNAPCRTIFKLKKLKTVLPSLKPPVDKLLKSNVVYQIKSISYARPETNTFVKVKQIKGI